MIEGRKWYVALGAVLVGVVWFLAWVKPDLPSLIIGLVIGAVGAFAAVLAIAEYEGW